MKWSEKAWTSIAPIYKEITELPFIKELMDGTLPYEKFSFYIQQDALYLAEYGRVLTGIASKLKETQHIASFIHFAGDSIAVENELHKSFVKEISSDIKPSPSCLLYTSYLMSLLGSSPREVICAGVLPCFWIYNEIGKYILANQTTENNIYQNWINTYEGEEFTKSVLKAISICDELAENCTEQQQEAMTEAFIMCSKFEWMFWDSAYRMEQWKI